MVTVSDLKRLEAINIKNDKESRSAKNQKPGLFSMEWLVKEELYKDGGVNGNNLAEIDLRNKRLELLFHSVDIESEDTFPQVNSEDEDAKNETSISYPTTVLKHHELTNELEIDLMESSLFSNRRIDLSKNQVNDANLLEHNRHDLHRSLTKTNSWINDSLRSSDSANSILLRHKSLEEKRVKASSRHNPASLGIEVAAVNNLNPKPLKRFRSVSQCDLVFPNLNFKNPKR
ncbi:hypothetical protein CANMA_001802 [Candida margitis]|uniref:uncharacterized protein n=1 Tax=Candida margitis TaxID=1775924 RepID=UPI0022273EDC|nr:uncharacterized protein CANMA_001802 [Candida margitis]KAI5969135.1 hypothetical protein CANMA_001802 [Candida margitis]